MTRLADPGARPILLGALGLCLALGLAAGPVMEAFEAWQRIGASRERLARARAAASRPPVPAPLAGTDADALAAAFRARLDALAGERAIVLDRAEVEPDPGRPSLPRLRAALRGTAEGLHGLLHALETEAPLVAIETGEIALERQADPETGRPTIMRLAFTARGVLLSAEPETPPVPGETP